MLQSVQKKVNSLSCHVLYNNSILSVFIIIFQYRQKGVKVNVDAHLETGQPGIVMISVNDFMCHHVIIISR